MEWWLLQEWGGAGGRGDRMGRWVGICNGIR